MSNITSLSLQSPALLPSFHHPLLRTQRSSVTMANMPAVRTAKRSLTVQQKFSDVHITRRSAEYQPNNWDYDLLESLSTQDFKGEKYEESRDKMIREVKELLKNPNTSMDTLSRLELVDAIDRLGLKRHFHEELKSCVHLVYCGGHADKFKDAEELYATALWFKALRKHGYQISEDIFNKFKDNQGNIHQELSKDTKGLLSLYEASFLECRGDEILNEFRAFAIQHLKAQLSNLPPKSAKVVKQSLDMPLHWRFPRLKARLCIEEYDNHLLHPSLITLAKLDYNMVQASYKEDIRGLVRWWKEMRLPEKLPYIRDRLMEHYLWCVGTVEGPEYHHYREMETKVLTLITAIDDTYDVYGTLEELETFTHLIDKWDIEGIDQLPEPMRHCFLAVYNTTNEISDSTFKKKGFHIVPYLSRAWARLCKKYMQEAKWYHEGCKPAFSEYIHNGIVSCSAHLILIACYLLTTPSISNEAVDYINSLPNLVSSAGIITRLTNDLGTSSDELARGDTLKAVECYMHQSGVSEEVAREHINSLIRETWKKMNEEYYLLRPQYPPTISEPFLSANLNLAQSSQFFYSSKKDWHGKPDKEMINHIRSLLINPIPM